jgi:cytochrome c oxidase cbb3-type subunit III
MPDLQQGPRSTGHTYDGIEEYDNPLPGWWKWLWAATIIFAGGYLFVVTLVHGQMSPIGEYDRAAIAELKSAGGLLKPDSGTLVRLMKDEDSMKAGAAIFATNCVACHNRDASGLIGPNLTDDFYIHVRKIEDIPDVVTKGRKSKTAEMPSWANRLSPNEIVQVSSYVASLRGLNRPGKPPEGKIIPAWIGASR